MAYKGLWNWKWWDMSDVCRQHRPRGLNCWLSSVSSKGCIWNHGGGAATGCWALGRVPTLFCSLGFLRFSLAGCVDKLRAGDWIAFSCWRNTWPSFKIRVAIFWVFVVEDEDPRRSFNHIECCLNPCWLPLNEATLRTDNYSPLRKEGGRKKENGRRKEESLWGKRKKVGRGRSPKEKGRGVKGQESEGKRPWGRRWWRGRWGKLFEFLLCCKKSYWMSMDFWPMHITKYLCLKPYESLNVHPNAQSCTPCFSLFGIQEEEEEETEQVDDNLEKCNIIELKDKLRAMNLPVSGRKAELIQRIRNAKW